MNADILHETFTFERTIAAPPSLIFKAWADPAAREIWGPPSNTDTLKYTKTDFRVGGTDSCLCGPKDNMSYQVDSHYLDIVEDQRLIFTESIQTEGILLSSSLATIALDDTGTATQMQVTVQLVSLMGDEVMQGVQSGWTVALGNLEAYLIQAS